VTLPVQELLAGKLTRVAVVQAGLPDAGGVEAIPETAATCTVPLASRGFPRV